MIPTLMKTKKTRTGSRISAPCAHYGTLGWFDGFQWECPGEGAPKASFRRALGCYFYCSPANTEMAVYHLLGSMGASHGLAVIISDFWIDR